FQSVGAVFERILDAIRVRRQLAGFADDDETDSELIRDGRSEDEAPRLHSHHDVDPIVAEGIGHHAHRLAQGGPILKQRSDVLEADTWFGKVGYDTNLRLQIHPTGTPFAIALGSISKD